MKYMHAIGQHERLSLANGLLQMFSQADKLRTVSRVMPGVQKKKEKKKEYSKFESQNWKSNANPPNEYSNILVQPYINHKKKKKKKKITEMWK